MRATTASESGPAILVAVARQEKVVQLDDAMQNGKQLPIKPIDMKYWPDYLEKAGS